MKPRPYVIHVQNDSGAVLVTMLDALAALDAMVVGHAQAAASNLLPLPGSEEVPRSDVLTCPLPRREPGGLRRAGPAGTEAKRTLEQPGPEGETP
jgi:hypothetical protein